jgi:pyruvate/2-oxoglutarate dehydrogenase complex dihydrolipoamide acyltransferase (E2) component
MSQRIALSNVNDALGKIADMYELDLEEITNLVKETLFVSKKKKKIENLFSSTAAKQLAIGNGLTQDDFLPEEKTGNPRKSGAITITITDVRKKLGKKINPFASPTAKKFANEKNVSAEEVTGTGKNGKITKTDIELFLGLSPSSSPKSKSKVPKPKTIIKENLVTKQKKRLPKKLPKELPKELPKKIQIEEDEEDEEDDEGELSDLSALSDEVSIASSENEEEF